MTETLDSELQAEGYVRYETPSPFVNFIGGFWCRRDDDAVVIAFAVRPEHLNTHGTLHGGMLMALSDQLVAMTSKLVTGHTGLTMHVDADLLSTAPLHARVDGRARVLRRTRSTAFVEGHLYLDGEPILRTSGVVRLGPPVSADG